jgi:RNA polymerase sigma factor (sigma-70 family)
MDVSTEDVNTAYETWKAAEGQEKEDALKILLTAVKHYAKRLMLSSKRRNPPDLADEIAEDVILSLETFKGRAKFSTWVGRIILNKWSDYNRKRKREKRERSLYAASHPFRAHNLKHGSSNEEEAEFEIHDPKAVAIFRRAHDAQIVAWDTERVLSEKDQSLFQQVWREGKTHREIAETLGMSVHAVESAVRRLRGRLDRTLKNNCRRTTV